MNVSALPGNPILPPLGDPSALAGQSNSKDPRAVESVATGFESLFASMLLKQMRQSIGQGSLFEGDKADVLGGMFDYFMGQHLAPSGSLGIAAMVRQQLMPHARTP
jgi:peptidoglycan hydrolase FlgJ